MNGYADVKTLVLKKVGAGLDGLPDEVQAAALDAVTPLFDSMWALWLYKAQLWPGLVALYVTRECFEVIAGQNRDRFNVTVGSASVQQGSLTDTALKMRDSVQKEIERVEAVATGSRPPVMAQMASQLQADACGRVFDPLALPLPRTNRVY